jgi:hypothetical protein
MSAPFFNLELFGGPADGFKVAMPQAPARTVRMPASPSAASSDDGPSHHPSGKFLALYDLASRQDDFDCEVPSVIRLRYEFVGLRACDERVSRWRPRWLRRLGWTWLRHFLTGIVRKCPQVEADRPKTPTPQ